MSRMYAPIVAMFAASLLVLAVFGAPTFGPGRESPPPASPAALGQVEPGTAGNPPPRINSDMRETFRRMDLRTATEASGRPEGAGPARDHAASRAPPVAGKRAARNPPNVNLPAIAAPSPTVSTAAQQLEPPSTRSSSQEAQGSNANRTGPAPINLLPRRSAAHPTDAPSQPTPQAQMPSAIKPAIAPSYTAAMPLAPSGAPAAPAPASILIPSTGDESNLTADQLNERELQRIRKRQEGETARGAPVR